MRRRIVEILASGEHSAGNVAEVVGFEFQVTRQAVSRQLRILRESGWIESRVDETTRMYGLRRAAIDDLSYQIARLEYFWERRIGTQERNDPKPHHTRPFVWSPTPRDGQLYT